MGPDRHFIESVSARAPCRSRHPSTHYSPGEPVRRRPDRDGRRVVEQRIVERRVVERLEQRQLEQRVGLVEQ
jgi:hypothetical protein